MIIELHILIENALGKVKMKPWIILVFWVKGFISHVAIDHVID